MSNLFNYELDETRIRTTLKTPECSFCENTWQAFDNLFVKEMHRQPVQESKPKVKFELNYKALTPVLFFGAIVCSSVVLFKVIRFNKNTEASVDNKTSVAKASLMPAISSAKEASSNKPDLALTTHESAATITVASTPAKAQILPAVEVSATTPVVEAAVSSATVAAKPAYKPMAKRKPATETEEVQAIQSITPAGVLTNSNEQEPELDLK